MEMLNAETAKKFLDGIDCFLFDCDGVLLAGSKAIPGAAEALLKLRKLGKRVVFVSNNSTKSRAGYAHKLNGLGIQADKEEVVGSAFAAAFHLKNDLNYNPEKKVYVVGMAGIKEELADVGLTAIGMEEDDHAFDIASMEHWTPDPSVGAVISGLDFNVNYVKMGKACRYLQNPDVLFIATNDDTVLPLAHGIRIPGSGAWLSVLTTATQRTPIICGKPNQPMLDVVIDKFGLDPHRSCMVGDRLSTDIAFGNAGGVKTLLVLTGVSTLEDAETCTTDMKP
eukprot:Ihof_evm19s39 gene=Ihof_evmTU19s39